MNLNSMVKNRIAEGKVPVCAAMCSTKALLVGDAESVSNVIRARVTARGGKRRELIVRMGQSL